MFKPGDVVQIAPNSRMLDCCQGKRGRIYGPYAGDHSKLILNTDHFCPVARDESELTLVDPQVLAHEYFEIEGAVLFNDVAQALHSGEFTLDQLKFEAGRGDALLRQFVTLWEAGVKKL